jgi:hypothetical protein
VARQGVRLERLAHPGADPIGREAGGDARGLLVGVRFDAPAVRCDDDQRLLRAVVGEPLDEPALRFGPLVRQVRVQDRRAGGGLEHVVLPEPAASAETHADDAVRRLVPRLAHGVDRPSAGRRDPDLPTIGDSECCDGPGVHRAVLLLVDELALLAPDRLTDGDGDIGHGILLRTRNTSQPGA